MRGFSLVELSIVLVILGLLTGGILAGQSLIRAAELRAVTAEYSRYAAAVHSFRDKYRALPGDMREATRFWFRLNGNTDCVTNTSAATGSPGACDGNGDGTVGATNGANPGVSREETQFWRQLALAGLIEGTYTGVSGASAIPPSVGQIDANPGENTPTSKLRLGTWGPVVMLYQGYGVYFNLPNANYMSFGEGRARSPRGPVMKPDEAWNIDVKMDDGRPGYGGVIAVNWATCSTATTADGIDSDYLLSSSATGCAFLFKGMY